MDVFIYLINYYFGGCCLSKIDPHIMLWWKLWQNLQWILKTISLRGVWSYHSL